MKNENVEKIKVYAKDIKTCIASILVDLDDLDESTDIEDCEGLLFLIESNIDAIRRYADDARFYARQTVFE